MPRSEFQHDLVRGLPADPHPGADQRRLRGGRGGVQCDPALCHALPGGGGGGALLGQAGPPHCVWAATLRGQWNLNYSRSTNSSD